MHVITAAGMQFFIYSGDHNPAHVHVIYDGGQVKIELKTGLIMRITGRPPKGRERRIREIVAENETAWMELFYALNPHEKR